MENKGKLQINVSSMMGATAMVAVTLALCRYFSPYLVLPILILPIAYAFEALVTGFGSRNVISFPLRVGRLVIIVGIAAMQAALSYWSLSAGNPRVATPLPFLSVLPALYGLAWIWIIGIPFVAFTVTVLPSVWLEADHLPMRLCFLLGAGTLASIYWFITGWSYAVQYQSLNYAIGVASINLVILLALWTTVCLSGRSPSFLRTLGFATMIFAWLFCAAFPWMGELP